MPVFIQLNRDNSNDAVNINMSAVSHFERREGFAYTLIEFWSGTCTAVAVSQTPKQIYDLIRSAVNNHNK